MASGELLDGRRLEVFKLPMTTRFRGVTSREGVLVFGDAGVGEFSPFWDYDATESAIWLGAALEAADIGPPAALRDRVQVNCTVPAIDPERAAAIVRGSSGCRTAKVKVAERGQTLDDDVARVAAVRAALGPEGRVRVDANGGWSVAEAIAALRELSQFELEYAEQPVADVEGLRDVRARTSVPIAADESIRRARDPLRVAQMAAADVVVLKVQPLGGVRACLALAGDIGLPVVVSSALESSVGIAAGVALAAALPDLPFACGLATTALLGGDLVRNPATVVDGAVAVDVPTIDDDALDRHRADPETHRRWLDRIAACERVLGEPERGPS
jgi:O-succinylbenzoate synthase